MITEITPEISITDGLTAKMSAVAELGFRAVLCLDAAQLRECHAKNGVEVRLRHLEPNQKSLAQFDDALDCLQELVNDYGRVLVHCQQGECRSVAVVAAYLVRRFGEEPRSALAKVASLRNSRFIPRELEILVLSQS